MNRIFEILERVERALFTKYYKWQTRRARKKLNAIEQHWQAVRVGGGANIQLGTMKRSDAIKMTNELRDGPIIFIDDQRGVVAFGEPSDAVKEK